MRTYTADEVDAMIGRALARERELPAQHEYERGFIDGMQEQMKRSVDRAVNAIAQPAQQQEPVAWICEGSSSDEKHAIDYWPGNVDDLPIGTQLYTSPPAQRTWVGLTDEEVWDLWNSHTEEPFPEWFVDFKRAYKVLEAKLKEKNT